MKLFFLLAASCTVLSFSPRPAGHDLTVSYSITLKSKKKDTGIGESYNGGVKTVFVSDGQVRLRLVSLMRMQSIFVLPAAAPEHRVAIVKESGRDSYKYFLTPGDWKQYNSRYEGLSCRFMDDTLHLLGYMCRKAVITLKTKETVTAWYTSAVSEPALGNVEPLFSSLPGLVLKYEYTYRKGTIVCTATSINRQPIEAAVFAVPGSKTPERKYLPGSGR
ncbi:MAG: hypothetical protein JST39_08055 [Bacteroidetes bacterium]|nr:hypothetical protein [Bacteroidota bacterium]